MKIMLTKKSDTIVHNASTFSIAVSYSHFDLNIFDKNG